MQQNFNAEELETLSKIDYLAGSLDTIELMKKAPSKEPFSDEILEFLNLISRELMDSKETRSYPDLVTLGFWLRKSNITNLKESYFIKENKVFKNWYGNDLLFTFGNFLLFMIDEQIGVDRKENYLATQELMKINEEKYSLNDIKKAIIKQILLDVKKENEKSKAYM